MWERDIEWADPEFDPYKHDPVVQVSCVVAMLVFWVLTPLLLWIF
jgi:hypothetical protein